MDIPRQLGGRLVGINAKAPLCFIPLAFPNDDRKDAMGSDIPISSQFSVEVSCRGASWIS
jgi:hypothetical protein